MPGARPIVGLTGGIGCGKTTVADLLVARGVAIVDTDAIAHRLTAAGGRGLAAIVRVFGEQMLGLGGAMNRAAMRALAFADPTARSTLEAILHPLIREDVDVGLASDAVRRSPYVLLAVPLLFESMAYRDRVLRVIAVDCPVNTQVLRVTKRSGLAADEVSRIIASQVARPLRLQLADDVVVNHTGPEALLPQVDALHRKYLEMIAAGRPC